MVEFPGKMDGAIKVKVNILHNIKYKLQVNYILLNLKNETMKSFQENLGDYVKKARIWRDVLKPKCY